jgi:hypothetical protein
MTVWTKPCATWGKNFLSLMGLLIASLTLIIVLYNMFGNMQGIPSPYRVTISVLLFAFAFVATTLSKSLGLRACLFLLPLLPNLTFQILSYTGYGRILHQDTSGFDLLSGFICGALVNHVFISRKKIPSVVMPWPAGLLLLIVTLSVVLAVARNLAQSSALPNFSALLYSLTHIRSIGWHDDYRPLFDWVAYGLALGFFSILLPVLKDSNERNNLVFKPLIAGVLVAAVVGLIQNRFGIGLNPSQLQFRSTNMSYGYDVFGFSSVGFQPDIHAFAGYLMLGAVGMLGYLYSCKDTFTRYLIPLMVIPLSFIAMLASKSKSSVALTVLFLIVLTLLWLFRRSAHFIKIVSFFLVMTALVFLSFYVFQDAWENVLTLLARRLGFADLYAMNFSMAFRPEIYLAAFRMLAEVPLMGLGQGNFYRLSAIPSFSQSPFLTETLNGENAHNYFIQVLTENGVIGFCIFAVFVFYPVVKIKNKKQLIPALVALGSLFLGNLYAHSLLVRENLFICSGLIALMYAWVLSNQALPSHSTKGQNITIGNTRSVTAWTLPGVMLIVCLLAIKEVHQSFAKSPFTFDYQCYKTTELSQDKWTTGRYLATLPTDTQGVRIELHSLQPDSARRSLGLQLALISEGKETLASQRYDFKEGDMQTMEILLPANTLDDTKPKQVMLMVERCFVPKNFGMSGDQRRLGVRINSIDYLHK